MKEKITLLQLQEIIPLGKRVPQAVRGVAISATHKCWYQGR